MAATLSQLNLSYNYFLEHYLYLMNPILITSKEINVIHL